MLNYFKKILNARLTRELWVKIYVEAMSNGNSKDYSQLAADNAVVAYNEKFIQVKIKLN